MSRDVGSAAARVVASLLLGLVVLTGCQGDEGSGGTDGATSASSSPTDAPSATARAAEPPPSPRDGVCYRMTYDEALAPTNEDRPVPCRRAHQAVTFHVGELDTVVDGHLLAVDSRRVRARVAERCPRRLAGFLGGSEEDRRLSMLSAVWFSPTVRASDDGENWYRCDLVALASAERLAPLGGGLRGVLDEQQGRDRYGVCGTAKPGTRDFRRVICSARHSWRAVATVDVAPGRDGDYPGADAARAAGESRCEDEGRERADDPLDFSWGYEWPTREQWRTGQRYGLCWVPAG